MRLRIDPILPPAPEDLKTESQATVHRACCWVDPNGCPVSQFLIADPPIM